MKTPDHKLACRTAGFSAYHLVVACVAAATCFLEPDLAQGQQPQRTEGSRRSGRVRMREVQVASPDGKVKFTLLPNAERLTFTITLAETAVIEPSSLEMHLDGVDLSSGVALGSVQPYEVNDTYPWYGGFSMATNRCNGARIEFEHDLSMTPYQLEVRVFNNGAAFRHVIPGDENAVRVPDELSRFLIPAGSKVWYAGLAAGHYEDTYRNKDISAVEAGEWSGPPLTCKLPGQGGYASITEANLVGYSGMGLEADGRRGWVVGLGHRHPLNYPFELRYGREEGKRLSKPAAIRGTITTPWRVVMVGRSLHALVSSSIVPNLCPPPDPALFPQGLKTPWIRPGRAVWRYLDGGQGGVNGMKEFSRMAGQLGFQHHVIEGFWSRWSMEERKDLVNYSKQQGVGIWLWKHSKELRTPEAREEFFRMLHEIGATGAKIDFFDHDHKELVDLYEALLAKAAEYQIMLNFHGANKPTGRERTWPNDMVREAVKGMEASRLTDRARHQATLPFTRFLAGAADYTTMIFSQRRGDTTWANQIASMAIFSSPLLTIAANPQSMLTNPAVEMIKSIPAVWDETRVLPDSEIGELAAYARRIGNTWFVAAMCGPLPKTLQAPLSFLAEGEYKALLVRDGETDASLSVENTQLKRTDALELKLRAGGGFIARFSPMDRAGLPVPPAQHPRLYLRAAQAAELPARLKHPVLQPAIQRLQAQAEKSPQSRAEWDALQYLVTRDAKLGRTVIETALPLLQKCELANRMDACRETGRMMVTGAIVYDWCYPLLTPAEKQAFIQELVRLAKTQECGYPPTRQGSVTGHASEAMIMRDMLSAGIAIYDEFPEMYDLAAGRFFREHLPARNWFYPGQAYHQGDSYGPHRYSWDTYPLWIFDRLGAGNVFNPDQHWIPYLWIYTTRPDGQRLRAGDTFASSAPRGRPWSQYIGTLLTASYYNDGILLDQFLRQGGAGGNETIFEVLWRDTSLQPEPISTLPLSRYFGSPFGWAVARTGWGDDAVIAEMKINEYNFVNHQHLDAGAFQIFYRGALAIDSGLYEGGTSGNYGSPHCLNYYWRTIAHNSLLVYDPKEDFGKRGYGNDGGQRLPNGRNEARDLRVLLAPTNGYRTGKVLAHGFGPDPQTPDYTLLQGDLTDAYSKKVRQLTRSFVFLNLGDPHVPAALVIFDRVISAQPDFRKFWLLHTLEEPTVTGASATVDCTDHGANGRLNLDVLLPAADNAALSKIGGPGKEYWVFGANYANDVTPARRERTSMETGAWRLELSPKAAAAEDLFLTALQVTDRQSAVRWPVERLDAGERTGCLLRGPQTTWVILFRKDSQRSDQDVQFVVSGNSHCRFLVADLASGAWRAERSGQQETRTVVVPEDSAAAWFDGMAGNWTLRKTKK